MGGRVPTISTTVPRRTLLCDFPCEKEAEAEMRGPGRIPIVLLTVVSLTGCLGTVVETPRAAGRPIATTHVHVLAAPFRVDAHVCREGVAKAATFVPLWGVAVGILTFGILVPKTTVYHCAESR